MRSVIWMLGCCTLMSIAGANKIQLGNSFMLSTALVASMFLILDTWEIYQKGKK